MGVGAWNMHLRKGNRDGWIFVKSLTSGPAENAYETALNRRFRVSGTLLTPDT